MFFFSQLLITARIIQFYEYENFANSISELNLVVSYREGQNIIMRYPAEDVKTFVIKSYHYQSACSFHLYHKYSLAIV